jgi:CheY-like chemotaxis protein
MKTRILVINDAGEILDLMRMILEEHGYEVILFSYAIEEVKEIERLKPDLVILDIMMGTSDPQGWNTLQKLKLYPPTSHIPIIVCTAAERFVREQEGYLVSKGVMTLLKPFDLDDLLHMVHKALTLTPHTIEAQEQPGEQEQPDEPL